MANFATNLARIMADRGISQVDLAAKSGVIRQLIGNYLRESRHAKFPSLPNLLKLAKALNCTLEELTGLESLKGAEEGMEKVELTEEAQELWEAYQALDDNDPLKEFITKTLLEGSDSNEEERGG